MSAETLFSRRNLLKIGAALAAVPLAGDLKVGTRGEQIISTGSAELDQALGGGLKWGSFLVVVGPRGCGKSAFLLRLAKANGIMDAYPMGKGTSDMLSIMKHPDGRTIGSLMLDAAEPSTDKERSDMQTNPQARSAFLGRWFQRSREITHESGGLFAISACQDSDELARAGWLDVPDCVVALDHGQASLLRNGES